MQVNIQELVKKTGLDGQIYPGKKLLKKYVQPGEFKSQCILIDWTSDTLRVELKAGLTGKSLELKDLKNYPVSYQAPTYLEFDTDADQDNEEEEEGDDTSSASGKGGSGKAPASKKLEDSNLSLSAFGKEAEGKLTEKATIKKFVVMGKELAQEAFATAFENLEAQLGQTKVMAMDVMRGVGDIIKKATPGGGLESKGNETVQYKYDTDKTVGLFGGTSPS